MINEDEQLSNLLGFWSPDVTVPNNFNHRVWLMIERKSKPSLILSFLAFIAMPRYAATAAIIAVAIGSSFGVAAAKSDAEAGYLRSLIPAVAASNH